MIEQDLSEVETDDLIEELINRDELNKIGTDDLVRALQEKAQTTSYETRFSYQDYVVAIENGEINMGFGKVTILVVEETK